MADRLNADRALTSRDVMSSQRATPSSFLMSDKNEEYLEVLRRLIHMAQNAERAANDAMSRGENGPACLLDYMTRIEMLREYGVDNVPNRWRIN